MILTKRYSHLSPLPPVAHQIYQTASMGFLLRRVVQPSYSLSQILLGFGLSEQLLTGRRERDFDPSITVCCRTFGITALSVGIERPVDVLPSTRLEVITRN